MEKYKGFLSKLGFRLPNHSGVVPGVSWLGILALVAGLPWARLQTPYPIQIVRNDTRLTFPASLTFYIKAQSPKPIEKLTLFYGTNAHSCQESSVRQSILIEPSKEIDEQRTWNFEDSGSLPPGAEVWWQWEFSNSASEVERTPKLTTSIVDAHYSWQVVDQNGIELYWVEGKEQYGRQLLKISVDSLLRFSREAGILAPEKIQIHIYPSAQAVQNASLHLPDWTGGVAFTEYNSIMIGIPYGNLEWASQVIPHELAHLVTAERAFNCLGIGLPTWLNEGISVYAEGPASESELERLHKALSLGNLPPLRSLTLGFAADANRADLSYIQSGQVVTYLIQNYGPDKLAELFATIRTGKTPNAALLAVYGLDTDGLDQAWRLSQGIETDPKTTTAPTIERTAIPTFPIWTPAFARSSPTIPTGAGGKKISLTPTGHADDSQLLPLSQKTKTPTPALPQTVGTGLPREWLVLGAIFLSLAAIPTIWFFLKRR
jgi:hypothetical protein